MDVLCETRNGIAHLTLNRPAALNSLSLNMVNELHAQLVSLARDPGVHAVLLRGAGEKAFCAGGDIRALYDGHKARAGKPDVAFFEREYPLDYLLHCYPKPSIALIDGIVMGGGMGISQGARWRIVGDRTKMAMPEVGIGFFPDVGGSYFLSRLPGSLGTYLALTGNQIRAADAIYAGLADCHLPAASVAQLPAALDAIRWDSAAPVAAIDTAIRVLAADPGTAPLASLRAAIDRHFGQATVDAIIASLEAETRPEAAEWAKQTLKTLRGRSPTMLKVALRQLALGRDMDFADCLRMEIGMVYQCLAHGDFMEGVRALIVDKDNAPRWQPARLEDVTDSQVEQIFKNPWESSVHPLAKIEGVLESCN